MTAQCPFMYATCPVNVAAAQSAFLPMCALVVFVTIGVAMINVLFIG